MNTLPRTDQCFVISLPSSTDRRKWITEHFRVQWLHFRFIDGVVVDPEKIPPEAVKNLEAYGKYADDKRYQSGALGCRLAGLQTLQTWAKYTREWFIICQDDAVLAKNFVEKASKCIRELPDDAKLLWFDRSQITEKETPYSEHLNVNNGSRLCTCFWISSHCAAELVPLLKKSDTEWDIFMETYMKNLGAEGSYISRESLAKQKRGISLITWKRKWSFFMHALYTFRNFLSIWKKSNIPDKNR